MKDFLKLFLLELCCSYTIMSVVGAIVNIIAGTETNNANVLVMFAICTIVCFILSLHKLFIKLSPLAMIVIQFVLSIGLCSLLVLMLSIFVEPVTPRGWFEFLRSLLIPYVIGAGLYYYRVFKDAKEQAKLIEEIQELNKDEV